MMMVLVVVVVPVSVVLIMVVVVVVVMLPGQCGSDSSGAAAGGGGGAPTITIIITITIITATTTINGVCPSVVHSGVQAISADIEHGTIHHQNDSAFTTARSDHNRVGNGTSESRSLSNKWESHDADWSNDRTSYVEVVASGWCARLDRPPHCS